MASINAAVNNHLTMNNNRNPKSSVQGLHSILKSSNAKGGLSLQHLQAAGIVASPASAAASSMTADSVVAPMLPAPAQIFEILSSTFAVAKIQHLPLPAAEDPTLRSTTMFDKSLCCS